MFFYFLKIIFDISASKQSKNTKKILILSKKKFKYSGNVGWTAFPNGPWECSKSCILKCFSLKNA